MFKWLRDAKRLPEVESELDHARAEVEALRRSAEAEHAAATAAHQNVQKANARIAELEKKLRQQNEADLLLVSLQIVQRITAGEKKETSPRLQSLLDQQSGLQNAYLASHPYSGSGLLGALGLGGVFGPFQH